ncbi:MAG: PmoA family protein [Tunicatimonas sp.]
MKLSPFFTNRPAPVGRTVLFALVGWLSVAPSEITAQVQFTVKPDTAAQRVDIATDGQPFTAYIFPNTIKKPVLYPLRTPDGTVVTRGFPLDARPGERVDHPHHVGLWLNYGDVNGYDFWNNSDAVDPNGKYGTIHHRKVLETSDGKQGMLHVTADWITSDDDKVLEEETKFVFSAQNKDTYLIDRTTTFTAVGDVSLTDNKEGMLGVRVARALEHPSDEPAVFTDASGVPTEVKAMNNEGVNGLYRSSEGVEGDEVWGTRARWVQLSGRVDEQPASITIIDHPDNVGFPTYWHARGYGLFAANPLGQKALSDGREELNYQLQDGESVTFRYRVVLHAGKPLSDKQEKTLYDDFSGLSK